MWEPTERHLDREARSAVAAVVEAVTRVARASWSTRLCGVYVLGSAARGGFSAVVSDIDMVLVVADPLTEADAQHQREIRPTVERTGLKFANRVAAAWTSPARLAATDASARYPPLDVTMGHLAPLDRLDLMRDGVLVWGTDLRGVASAPTREAIDVGSAEFAVSFLRAFASIEQFTEPALLEARGIAAFSKVVLLPVRLLSMLRSGAHWTNEAAFAFCADDLPTHQQDLARLAMDARHGRATLDLHLASGLARDSLVELYVAMVRAYAVRMDDLGCVELARELRDWEADLRLVARSLSRTV